VTLLRLYVVILGLTVKYQKRRLYESIYKEYRHALAGYLAYRLGLGHAYPGSERPGSDPGCPRHRCRNFHPTRPLGQLPLGQPGRWHPIAHSTIDHSKSAARLIHRVADRHHRARYWPGSRIFFTATSERGTAIKYAGGPSLNGWMMMGGVGRLASPTWRTSVGLSPALF
jgi:hypothetical protein